MALAGAGGNGGGSLVCARWLHNHGARVNVFVSRSDGEFTPVPAQQLGILDLIIDGIIGYSLQGDPRGASAGMIRWANSKEAPILALDAPSGVDTTTGQVFDPAIRATATMTLALPKEGLRAPGVGIQTGELYLADIGVPPSLYAKPPLGLTVGNIFAQNEIIRLI